MPLSTDNISSGVGTTAVSTFSWAHTVNAAATSGTLLIAGIHVRSTASSNVTISSVRWGSTAGTTMTLLILKREQIAARAVENIALYYLVNPTTGTTRINVDFGNTSVSHVPIGAAISLQGTSVFQSSGVSSGGATSGAQSVTLATTGAGDLLIGMFGARAGATPWTTLSGDVIIGGSTGTATPTLMVRRAPATSGSTTITAQKTIAQASLHVGGVAVETTVAPPSLNLIGPLALIGIGQ